MKFNTLFNTISYKRNLFIFHTTKKWLVSSYNVEVILKHISYIYIYFIPYKCNPSLF